MASDKKINRQAIADWPEDERPRESKLSRGLHSLTDAELLAILLRTGMKGKSAVQQELRNGRIADYTEIGLRTELFDNRHSRMFLAGIQ